MGMSLEKLTVITVQASGLFEIMTHYLQKQKAELNLMHVETHIKLLVEKGSVADEV